VGSHSSYRSKALPAPVPPQLDIAGLQNGMETQCLHFTPPRNQATSLRAELFGDTPGHEEIVAGFASACQINAQPSDAGLIVHPSDAVDQHIHRQDVGLTFASGVGDANSYAQRENESSMSGASSASFGTHRIADFRGNVSGLDSASRGASSQLFVFED
jgi:hypothetical protein